MNTVTSLPIIAGVEITTDEEGRFNLNCLHNASDAKGHKRPSKWLATPQSQELIKELESQSPHEGFGASIVKTINGGNSPGTFAHELIAISYAGWISPRYQLQVNQAFMDYKTGKLKPTTEMTRLEVLQVAVETEKENLRLEAENEALESKVLEFKSKADFHDRVAVAPDAISTAKAAKIIGTGRNRLMAFMRQSKWVTRHNEPYQGKIEQGLLDVKIGEFDHPENGLTKRITTLITGKGLIKLRQLLSDSPTS